MEVFAMIDLLKVSFEENPESGDLQFITRNIDQFNRSRVGYDDFKPLTYFLRDENDLLGGGLIAATFWQWLHIDILWLEEKYRNQGFGRKLLLASEQKAIERGCLYAHLDT